MPVTALGLKIDDHHTLRVAVGLRLGTVICAPHQCQHCDEDVDRYSTHGLSCHYSEEKYHRHATFNSIVHSVFISANVSSQLEPTSLFRADVKCPDGARVLRSCDQLLV